MVLPENPEAEDRTALFGEQGYQVAQLIAAGEIDRARVLLYPLYREHMMEQFAVAALKLQLLAEYYVKLANPVGAIKLLEQALVLCEFTEDVLSQVQILTKIGTLYAEKIAKSSWQQGEAWEYYMEALDLALRNEEFLKWEIIGAINGLAGLAPNGCVQADLMDFAHVVRDST